MIGINKISPEDILRLREESPKLRERDFAKNLNISEADYVAAHVGISATRLNVDLDILLHGAATLGEVMALTRNESAVHEKIGLYEKISIGKHACIVLGEQIDLRVFPKTWVYGFAVEKQDGELIRRSLQFFNKAGEAVHKIHLRPQSDVAAYDLLVSKLRADEQSNMVEISESAPMAPETDLKSVDVESFRQRWNGMVDVHQFINILRDFSITRYQAVTLADEESSWPLDKDSVTTMMNNAVSHEVPIMCFIGNNGCIQIHSGAVYDVKMMGPWLNVMDPTFHMHLRTDHIKSVWAVRKPTKDGHVTSVEAYDKDNELIVQFFGQRHEGEAERSEWRALVEDLPRVDRTQAA